MTQTCINVVSQDLLVGNAFVLIIDKLPQLPIFCQSALLPSISLGEAIIPTSVLDWSHAGEKLTFDPLIVSFPINETLSNYLEIQKWMFDIATPEDVSKRVTEMRDIFSDGKLMLLNSENNVMATFTFKNMFPTNLSEISLDITQGANPVIATVTFKMSHFYLESLENQPVE